MGRPKNFSREEVLQKAITVFWKHGFADASLQDLEAATGVNKSGLYAEFKNKEDLYLASLQHYIDRPNRNGVLSQLPLGWKNVEAFLKLGQVCTTEEKGCFAVSSMRELAVLPAEAHDMVMQNVARMRHLLLKNIRAEPTKMDAEIITEMVMTFFSGFCLEQNLKTTKAASARKITHLMQVIRSI